MQAANQVFVFSVERSNVQSLSVESVSVNSGAFERFHASAVKLVSKSQNEKLNVLGAGFIAAGLALLFVAGSTAALVLALLSPGTAAATTRLVVAAMFLPIALGRVEFDVRGFFMCVLSLFVAICC